MRFAQTRILATAGVVGIIISVLGLVLFHISWTNFISNIREKTILQEGNMGYQYWRNSPSEEYIDFYVWHIENPDEIGEGVKPNVTQRGPYTYRVYTSKEQISSHNGTISYIQTKRYVIDLHKSIGDPKADTLTTIDMPLLNLINRISFLPLNVRLFYNGLFVVKSVKIHKTISVHTLIWGYSSPFSCLAVNLTNLFFHRSIINNFSCDFAAFTQVNNSYDGLYTVFDGKDDYHRTNMINTWNGKTSLSIWADEYGNMINGTDSTYFGQFLEDGSTVFTFESDICRSTYFTFEKQTTTRELTAFRFIESREVFTNYYINPSNIAFCIPDVQHCLPGGLLNVSLCRYGDGGMPVVLSLPHFLYADPAVLDMIHGVHPEPYLHQTYMDLEPNTGLPLNTSRRRQINAHIRPYSNIDLYKKVLEAYLPLVWYQERSTILPGYADHLYSEVFPLLTHERAVAWSILGVGLCVILITIICVVRCKTTKKKSSPISYSSIPINYNEESLPLLVEDSEL